MLKTLFNQISPFGEGRLGSNMGQQFWLVTGLIGMTVGFAGVSEMFTGLVSGVDAGLDAIGNIPIGNTP